MSLNLKLTENFTLGRFVRSATAERRGIDNTPGEAVISSLKALCLHVLQPLRDHYGQPVVILSGFRCPSLNEFIGGAEHSQHVFGEAADIDVPGIPLFDVAKYIENHLPFDQLILEKPPTGWIHVSYARNGRRESLTYTGSDYLMGLQDIETN